MSASPPPGRPSPGHGPFGSAGFKAGLALCVVLIGAGGLMQRSPSEPVAGVGLAFLVLASVGLLTTGAALLLERHLARRSR